MKVALIHDWLTGARGGEKCLEVLCRRFPRGELFTLLHRRGSTLPAIERMKITASWLNRLPRIDRHYRYWLPLMPSAIESLKLPADLDLAVSFSHAVAKGARVPPGVPHICYCFTPMRYAWHLRDEYFSRGGPAAWLRDRLLDRVRRWDQATSDRVTHFVAISREVQQRIRECYGRSSEVIYPPVDTDFYTPADRAAPREDFYLCVSALVPYKRVDHAVMACNKLGRKLVVIGNGPETARLRSLAGAGTTILGWQSDEVIRDHLRRCRALLFPGHEDFGIVPLEAQACGAPVIALGRGGAAETIRPADERTIGTGVWFDRPTIDELCEAMNWFEAHADQISAVAARQQAERFSLPRFERELLDYLNRVVGRPAAKVVDQVSTVSPLTESRT